MALDPVLFLTSGMLAIVAGLGYFFQRASSSEDDRPVLPSHYSSLLYTDPARYPGHCTSCGMDNEPGYKFCESCGSQIPTSDAPSNPTDVRRVFRE